jgi:hypothetical protein
VGLAELLVIELVAAGLRLVLVPATRSICCRWSGPSQVGEFPHL